MDGRLPLLLQLLLLLLARVPPGLSHRHYLTALPHGAALDRADALRGLGHKAVAGRGQLNWFGFDFSGHGYRWTVVLCRLDSDSDGQSNGLELGDPACALAVDGDGSGEEYLTSINLSHPGDANSTTTRGMPDALVSTVTYHTPTVPHSGIKSLMFVLAPLVVSGLVGLAMTHAKCAARSSCGRRLTQRRIGYPPLAAKPVAKNGKSDKSRPTLAARCVLACRSECSARSWSLDLLVGEAIFLFAVIVGLMALVANKQWNGKYRVANTLGQLASTLCWLAILPASRTSIWVWIFGIPFERAVKWHRLFGKLFIVSTYLHLIFLISRYGSRMLVSTIQWGPSKAAPYPYWGLISGIATTLIGLTAFEAIRRNSFEVFYFVHVPMVQVTAIAAILHAPGEEYRYPVVIAMVFYGIDLAGRFLWRALAVDSVEVIDADCAGALKLRVTLACKTIETRPGDYVFLRFPQISILESHPFSISTVGPGKGDLNFVIKGMGKGTFTDRLSAFCQRSDAPRLAIGVEGPYGHLGVRLEEYQVLWICAGGIGAAPMVNILMHLHGAVAAAEREGRGAGSPVSRLEGGGGSQLEVEVEGKGEDDDDGDLRKGTETQAGNSAAPRFSRLRRVHFCWVVRRKEDLEWYAEEMECVRKRQKRAVQKDG